jgi:AAA domain-containing protein
MNDRPDLHAVNGKGRTHKARIKLVPFDEIRAGTERRYLVKGLVPREGLTVIWGPPKSGKSYVTFDLCMHVALGWDYRGRRVHRGPVVYCAFEGQSGIRNRVEAFRQNRLAEDPSPVPFYLQPLLLDLVRDRAELVNVIGATLEAKPVAVVLDTLNRSLAGSESSDQDMSAYVQAADAIREAFGCAVIVVHHSGIEASRPRGHTSLTGAADAQLAVKRDTSSTVITVTVEWLKDGPEGDAISSRLEQVEIGVDDDGEPITACIVLSDEGIAASAPRRKLPRSAQRALRALESAIDKGGETPPASNHFPPGARTVTVDLWRNYAYAKGIADSSEPRARQRAFKRGYDALLDVGAIGIWQERVWIT